jgi:hypothetical protein
MDKEKDAETKLPKKTSENPSIGSYFEQVVFEQPSLERAREITKRLRVELDALGVTVDPQTGKVTIRAKTEGMELPS